MLGKLIKYDLKYGVKIFGILHGILLTASILGRFLFVNKIDFYADPEIIFSSVSPFIALYVLLFTSISLGVTAMLSVRFYRNLFTDEGYLSWTLPATPVQQLWAKIASGTIWYVLNILITAFSLFILVTGSNVTEAYAKIAPEMTDILGVPLSRYSLIVLAFSLAGSLSSVIMIYVCISIGQLFPGHRILGAILAYFILMVIIQVVVLGLMIIFNLFPGPYAATVVIESEASHYMFAIFKLSGGITIVLTIVEYFIMHYILNKKLNLI